MYMCFSFKKFVSLILISVIVFTSCCIGISAFGKEELTEDKGVFLPIIMYHSIIDNPSACNDYTVTPSIVDNDFKYLKEHGYQTVTIQDLLNYIQLDTPLPEKCVMITVDDGFYNNYAYLVPILQKYEYSAIISFVGEFTDITAVNDPHVLEYSYCTWEDIQSILDTGVIELGNHTYSMHSNDVRKGCSKLSYETEQEYQSILASDVGELQNEFKEHLGVVPQVFAYPYGYISKESKSVLKELGFKATLTCYEKPNYITKDLNCLFGLDRYNRSANYSTQDYMKKLLGDFYE
ncbi:MAG: polysaccharide deacetylase family protein [Oscillospiraceae bacterium]